MANTSKTYNNDGDNIVVASGGSLEIQSGGILDVKTGGIVKANGTQASHIADITNAASGTEIATAVNAILAALKGAGIVKKS